MKKTTHYGNSYCFRNGHFKIIMISWPPMTISYAHVFYVNRSGWEKTTSDTALKPCGGISLYHQLYRLFLKEKISY